VTSLTALIKLLPRVTEADTGCITPTQRAKLYRILNTNVEDPFRKDIRVMFRPATDMAVGIRVSIVQALEVIGDDQALTIVTRLADSNARTAGEKLIREAALECLPLLKSRLEEQRTSATLLRASDSGSDHKNTLVRGHTGNFEHDERELLREGP
jgi:HEAT repeat protein